MRDFNFGRLEKRHLCIRVYSHPLCNHWLRRFFSRSDYYFGFGSNKGTNGRCYCETGRFATGQIRLAGFGLNFWYSSYDGEVPCPCDLVIADMFPELYADKAR